MSVKLKLIYLNVSLGVVLTQRWGRRRATVNWREGGGGHSKVALPFVGDWDHKSFLLKAEVCVKSKKKKNYFNQVV